MKEPTVSVAMATYNGERFLQEQLESLARQTLLPCELVVCDDGSADGTLDILHRFAAEAPFPVRIYRNETRLGYGFNFLGALGLCTGDLVAFCDQDDIWKEQKLRLCTEVMRDPAFALVSHSARVVCSNPLPRPLRHPDHRSSIVRDCSGLPAHRPIPGFSMVLRRSVLERVHPPDYDAALAPWTGHDVWAVVAALSCGHVSLLEDELAYYRLHEGNASMRPPRAGLSRMAPDADGFERMAELKEGIAGALRYAASFCDEPVRKTFYEYISQLESVGRLYRDRAELHRACGHRFAAMAALARMIAKRDYAPRRLGAKALARDLLLVALWRTAGPERTATANE